uniref:Uncharacterized protein n=1 Tax=Meloidogyne enterolobii TaxID=390850 RepID=A0A6V7VGD6_MELEN|nr:unnamed protein product [Meloidogyne enterolobii]
MIWFVVMDVVNYTSKYSFKEPRDSLTFTLYYFEVKCKFNYSDEKYKRLQISLKSSITDKYIAFFASSSTIHNEENKSFNLAPISWNNNDTFGCGLVYPPTNMTNEFPYVFFTQNGKQIGKAILIKDDFCKCEPSIYIRHCSIKVNFGNDLLNKPFIYSISKHLILKEFYETDSK